MGQRLGRDGQEGVSAMRQKEVGGVMKGLPFNAEMALAVWVGVAERRGR